LAWLADVQWTVYPQKWSPVSCRSSTEPVKDQCSTTVTHNQPKVGGHSIIAVCLSVCHSDCEQDYCEINQPISLKHGVMIGSNNQKNRLNFTVIQSPIRVITFPLPSLLRNSGFLD